MNEYPNTKLKLALMYHGIILTKDAKDHMKRNRFGQVHFPDFVTTSGLVLKLNQNIYVNTPIRFEETPFQLTYQDAAGMRIAQDGESLPYSAEVIPAPKFALENHLLDGVPVRNLIMINTDRARISPISGCHFRCHFCNVHKMNYQPIDIKILDRAFQKVALEDPYAHFRHVFISGGTPRETEDDYAYMDEVYAYFPHHYANMEWDAMLVPRSKNLVPMTNRVTGIIYNSLRTAALPLYR